MSLEPTIFNRLKKLFRVEEQINTAGVDRDSKLGATPFGFDDVFIDSDLRHRINRWFADLVDPLAAGQWDSTTKLGSIADDVNEAAKVSSTGEYRALVTPWVNAAFDRAAGAHAPSVPVGDRRKVRDRLNTTLIRFLIRDVTLDDLAGQRVAIIGRILGRIA